MSAKTRTPLEAQIVAPPPPAAEPEDITRHGGSYLQDPETGEVTPLFIPDKGMDPDAKPPVAAEPAARVDANPPAAPAPDANPPAAPAPDADFTA